MRNKPGLYYRGRGVPTEGARRLDVRQGRVEMQKPAAVVIGAARRFEDAVVDVVPVGGTWVWRLRRCRRRTPG
jgi:hypothetical protein